MFTLIEETEDTVRIEIEIPLNKTNQELLNIAKAEVPYFNSQLFQKQVKLFGNFPSFIVLYLAHAITHMTISVSIYVDGDYIQSIYHGIGGE